MSPRPPRPPDEGRGGGAPEPATFDEAYRACKPLVLWALAQRGVYGAAAEDACHNVFVRLLQRDPDSPGGIPHPVRTALLHIVQGEAMNDYRSRRRHPTAAEADPEAPDSRPDQEQALGRLQTAREAMAAIAAQMKKEALELILLADFGMSHAELAALRATTPQNIASQLSRARAEFRKVGAPVYDLLYGSGRGS